MKRTCYLAFACLLMLAANCLAQKTDTVAKPVYKPSPVLLGFYKVPGLPERTQIYNNSLKQYPDTGHSANISYAYARMSMAEDYAKAGNIKSAEEWLKLITARGYHDEAIARVAAVMIKNNDPSFAEQRLRPIIDSLYTIYLTSPKSAATYPSFINVYMYALRLNNQPERIIHYLKPYYEKNGRSFPSDQRGLASAKPGEYKLTDNMLFTYAVALGQTGQPAEAVKIFTGMSMSGIFDAPNLKTAIKTEYTKLPGGTTYHDKLADSIKQVYADKLKAFAANKKDMNGNTVNFATLKGKYILLDFWGSWCGPCRASHPHLKELYAKYKDKGFEIVGIAQEHSATLEQSRKLWTEAIAKDDLIWIQILDNENLDKFNTVAQYGIGAFPTKILLAPDGKIIGRYIGNGPAGEGFTNKLAEVFGK